MHPIHFYEVLTFSLRVHQAFGYDVYGFELDPPKTGLFTEGGANLFSTTSDRHELGPGDHRIRVRWQQLLSGKWSASVAIGEEPETRGFPQASLEDAIVKLLNSKFQARLT